MLTFILFLYSFTHIRMYEVSTMWYSPISCSICFLVGSLVSVLTKPQNIRKLNPDLISPAFFKAFKWFPWLSYLVRQKPHFQITIGTEYVRKFIIRSKFYVYLNIIPYYLINIIPFPWNYTSVCII